MRGRRNPAPHFGSCPSFTSGLFHRSIQNRILETPDICFLKTVQFTIVYRTVSPVKQRYLRQSLVKLLLVTEPDILERIIITGLNTVNHIHRQVIQSMVEIPVLVICKQVLIKSPAVGLVKFGCSKTRCKGDHVIAWLRIFLLAVCPAAV